jgi:hypothetical protein
MQLILSGAFVSVLAARVDDRIGDDDLDDAVEHLLRLFGLRPAEAHELTHQPLRALPRARTARTARNSSDNRRRPAAWADCCRPVRSHCRRAH